MNRRKFLEKASIGIVAASVLGRKGFANSAPNDRIQLGCIGVGGMGRGNMNNFLSLPDVDVVALCDVYKPHLEESATAVLEKSGKQPDLYGDFRDLLEREDIDAVMVGTPDHWHCLITALACKSKKDVYVEKPLAHNVKEGRMALKAARENERIVQLGTQVHATENYRKAAELVQSGVLGAITQVRVWLASDSAPGGIGNPPDESVPEGFDYNTWLGPAKKEPYNPNRSHFNWRYFWEYGGGKLGDFGCHTLDIVLWGINPGPPKRVSSIGGRYLLDDNADTPDTQDVVWEFDAPPGQSNPFQVVWSHTECNKHGLEGRGMGIKFCGVEGSLVVNYDTFQHYDRNGELVKENKAEDGGVGAAGVNHKREFIDCIRSRQLTSCDIEYAHRLTTLPLIGNVANRVGRVLEWDAEKELFVGDAEANRLLTREYRKGWDPVSLGIVAKSTPKPQRPAYNAWGMPMRRGW